MLSTLRLILLCFMGLLSTQAWSYSSTTSPFYFYDASEYLNLDRCAESTIQETSYAGESSFPIADELQAESTDIKIRAEAFIASVDGFFVTKGAGKAASKSDDVIHVTKDGVALPPGSKHKTPDNYVQNPHRSGNYGEIVDGKFKERLRIDPPTPPGQKGPNYSHYHKNGKGTHYSPRPGDKDPGF